MNFESRKKQTTHREHCASTSTPQPMNSSSEDPSGFTEGVVESQLACQSYSFVVRGGLCAAMDCVGRPNACSDPKDGKDVSSGPNSCQTINVGNDLIECPNAFCAC